MTSSRGQSLAVHMERVVLHISFTCAPRLYPRVSTTFSTSVKCANLPKIWVQRGVEDGLGAALLLDARVNLVDLVVHLTPLSDLILNLFHRVHDGGVVAPTEVVTDLGQ